jgi:Ca2+-binding EF-hand superfamily protein
VHDIDADGYLNRQEYQAFLEQRRRCHVASGRPARDFRHPMAFSEIDANGDQYISERELTAVLGQRLRERKRRHRGNSSHD